jgi:hypothetical protein
MTRLRLPSVLLVALVLASAAPARAEWVKGVGQRVYGPDTAQAAACRDADLRARDAALKARLGERFSAEDVMICADGAARGTLDKSACSLNRTIWNTVDGAIRAERDKRVRVRPGPVAGFHVCTVSLEADVGKAIGQSDPGFDLGVTMDASVFRPGDSLSLSVTPTQPMHVAVFQWLPYDHGPTPVTRIFPNVYDSDDLFTGPGTIPTRLGKSRYAMQLVFPDSVPPATRMVDEYLMIVATKRKIDFRQSYSLDGFRGRLLEIPRNLSRLVRRAYSVVRAPDPAMAAGDGP